MYRFIRHLLEALKEKNPYTYGHSKRVSQYTKMISEKMHLSNEVIQKYEAIALLHDIGKLRIPDSLLNKNGTLTEVEFDTMKKHCVFGVEIIENESFDSEVIFGIMFHHERVYGKGYPTGLKGSEIPLVARIIAVADTFDAMTSDRPYRKSLDVQTAIEELERCKGSQFDPNIAQLMIDALKSKEIQIIQ